MEVHHPDSSDILWNILKYIGTGFVSITSMFFLWVFGRYKSQHELMYSLYLDNTGKSALTLSTKLEEEEKRKDEEFKHLINRVIELEENYQKLESKIDKIEEFKAHFDQIVTEMILEEQLVPKINIDIKIDLSEILFAVQCKIDFILLE